MTDTVDMSVFAGIIASGYRRPGTAAAMRHRNPAARFLAALPLWALAAMSVVMTVTVFSVANGFGMDAQAAAAVAFVCVPVAAAVLTAPRILGTVALVSVFVVAVYGAIQFAGGTAAMWLGGFAWVWLLSSTVTVANRYARVEPLAVGVVTSVTLGAMFLAASMVSMSLRLSLAAATVCLVFLAVSIVWPSGVYAVASTHARLHRGHDAAAGAGFARRASRGRLSQRDAEHEVAGLLDSLPGDFHVFHSLNVRKGLPSLPHLVVGPTGVFAIDVAPVSAGLTVGENGIPDATGLQVNVVAARTHALREAVAGALGYSTAEVAAVTVLCSGTDSGEQRSLLSVREVGSNGPGHLLTMLSASALLPDVDNPLHLLSVPEVRVTAARAARAFRPTRLHHHREEAVPPVQVGGMSRDGAVAWLPVSAPGFAPGSGFAGGEHVSLLTPTGPVPGFRVVSAPHLVDGLLVVNVCFTDRYDDVASGRSDEVYQYPVAALQVSSTH